MSLIVYCPNSKCGKKLKVEEELLGRKLRCPKCEKIFVLKSEESKADLWPDLEEEGLRVQGSGKRSGEESREVVRYLSNLKKMEKLAEGGMGEIVVCNDRDIRREVAMKVIKPGIADSEKARQRFISEAQITGQLEHPNIVPVYEMGVDADGNDYFTMKKVEGKSLGQILRNMKVLEESNIQRPTSKIQRQRMTKYPKTQIPKRNPNSGTSASHTPGCLSYPWEDGQ